MNAPETLQRNAPGRENRTEFSDLTLPLGGCGVKRLSPDRRSP